MRDLYVDMEMATLDNRLRSVFPDPRTAQHNIISIVAYDSYTKVYHVFVYRDDFIREQWQETRTLTDGKEYVIKHYR